MVKKLLPIFTFVTIGILLSIISLYLLFDVPPGTPLSYSLCWLSEQAECTTNDIISWEITFTRLFTGFLLLFYFYLLIISYQVVTEKVPANKVVLFMVELPIVMFIFTFILLGICECFPELRFPGVLRMVCFWSFVLNGVIILFVVLGGSLINPDIITPKTPTSKEKSRLNSKFD